MNKQLKKTKKFYLSSKILNNFSKKFNKKKSNKVFKNVNTKVNFSKLIERSDYLQNKKNIFENVISNIATISNQENSGRCWLFAFTNIMRMNMIKKYKLSKDFEFSQNYLFFYDKLEKANHFFNYIYKTKHIKLSNKDLSIEQIKLVRYLDNVTSDGGSWNIFCKLIEKYGIVPKSVMDDHFHSKKSKELNKFFNNFLKKSAFIIRNSKKDKNILIKELLYKSYKILTIFLGEPPKTFSWEYYEYNNTKKINKNKSKKYRIIENITPQEFYRKYVPYNVNDKICLINFPCKDIPYYNLYNVENTFTLSDKEDNNFVNVPINVMLNACKKSIKNDEAVWIGVDFGKFRSSDGFMDKNAFNYDSIFGFNNLMDKCDSLLYRQSSPGHAITIKGFNINKNNNNGFLIENSWGENDGNKGNYYMSFEWFNMYVYRIVVDKKCVSKKEINVLKKKPILLPYTNPFGALL